MQVTPAMHPLLNHSFARSRPPVHCNLWLSSSAPGHHCQNIQALGLSIVCHLCKASLQMLKC